MDKFKNSVAVVTGAGSGIGRALAAKLAGVGADVAISDINKTGLDETLQLLGNYPVETRADHLDVTNREGVFAYAKAVQAQFGRVNLVFNNAGAALNGAFAQVGLDDLDWQMYVNFRGVANGTKAFLPILEEAEWGHIINISSLFGLISIPGNSAYCASKFAVRGMTEALRIELEMAKSSVSCSCVHPGGVDTNVVRNSRTGQANSYYSGKTKDEMVDSFQKLARTSPEKAADIILRGVARNRKRILVGTDAWVVDKVQRLFPTHYFAIMRNVFGYGKGVT